ncbi:MAG: hypothetical protein IPN15_20085 [Saprospiraceae bacterium]|nr:hypothetical protein [Candidatus Vicinibacter affinis]
MADQVRKASESGLKDFVLQGKNISKSSSGRPNTLCTKVDPCFVDVKSILHELKYQQAAQAGQCPPCKRIGGMPISSACFLRMTAMVLMHCIAKAEKIPEKGIF